MTVASPLRSDVSLEGLPIRLLYPSKSEKVKSLPVFYLFRPLRFVHQKREKNLRFFMTYAASASSLVIVVNPWSISV
jgi:hypothetical protein